MADSRRRAALRLTVTATRPLIRPAQSDPFNTPGAQGPRPISENVCKTVKKNVKAVPCQQTAANRGLGVIAVAANVPVRGGAEEHRLGG